MKLFKHPIVLETACGHDGNVKILKKLVDIAAASGAKVIKFQIFNLKERAKDKTKESRIFKQLVIGEKDWKFIINYSKSADTEESLFILFIASPIKGAMLICLIFFVFFTSCEA